jgi:hypothetical protein
LGWPGCSVIKGTCKTKVLSQDQGARGNFTATV